MTMGHLSDERLVELYLTGTLSSHEQQHLAECSPCEERRAALAHLLDETYQASVEDLEEVFPTERLARQHARILEQIQAASGPAQVISFPATAATPAAVTTPRPAMRWVAAAAVAGLVVGVVAGRSGGLGPQIERPRSVASAQVEPSRRPSVRPVSAVLSDEEVLVRTEQAIEGRGGSSLEPLDALTPRAWEVR